MISFKRATTKEDFELSKVLFQQYALDIGIDLSFQGFDKELQEVETQYGPPEGALIVIFQETRPIGCFALRKLDTQTCELKRMFLERNQRGKGIGKQMIAEALKEARNLGYAKIRLDSIKSMETAIALYQAFGFKEISAYRHNPFEDAIYFEKIL